MKKYQSYDNVRIINQENRGLSGARNVALQNIDANYVMFVDSDDKLAPGTIEGLLSVAYKNNTDIVQGGYTTFGASEKKKYICREEVYVSLKNYVVLLGKSL